jgi:hypothetical protein
LDDRVLAAGRALAGQDGISLGRAVSKLALRGLAGQASSSNGGFPLLSPSDPQRVITDDLVARYRDEP